MKNIYFDTPHPVKLYDLSIPDLNQRRDQAQTFATIQQAALFVGCTPATIRNNIGSRVLSPRWQKRFAVRAVSNQLEKRA